MKLFFRSLLFVIATGFLMLSCVKQESYSDIPEIGYGSFQLYFDTTQYAKRGVLIFSFQDGNGDIGLNPGDTNPPFEKGGPYYYNLVISYFEKQQGQWVEITLDPPYSARIPVLNPDYPGKPIKGYITDTLTLDPAPQFDTVKFSFFIYDRALNQSNVVTTPDIVLKRPY
jgi:hypothetical protein